MIKQLEELAEQLEISIEEVEREAEKLLEREKCGCGHDWTFLRDKKDAEVILLHMLGARKRGIVQGANPRPR